MNRVGRNAAVSVSTLAGITGSASGGMSIALAAMSDVFIQGAQRALVVDNAIHDNGVGIIVFDAKDDGNTIRNYRIYDNAESGIWIYKGSANTTVVNNALFSNFIEIQLGTSISSPAAAVRSEKV